MPVLEHFVYGVFEEGYRLIASPGIKNILPPKEFNMLLHLGDHAAKEDTVNMWFPAERLLSITTIRPTKDTHGRACSWNHTILVSLSDLIDIAKLHGILEPHLIRELPDPPKSLDPIML